MLQNSTLTQELSLATMVFAISELELVRIAMLPKIRQKCPWVSQLLSCVPDYKSYNIYRVFLVYSCIRYVHI